jgi:hypothetical protein
MILFVSYGGGHIAMTSELYKYFKQYDVEVKILPLTTAVSFCEYVGITDYLKLENFQYLLKVDNEVIGLVTTIANEVHKEGLGIPYEHTFMYHLIGISELISQYGIKEGLKIFNKEGRKAFLPVSFAKNIIDEFGVSAVVTTNVPRFEEAFQIAAREKQVKSFAIDDLIGKPLGEIKSDFVFVDNEFAKVNMEESGYTGNIVISGNPMFEKARSLKKTLKIKNNNLLILLQTGIRDMKTKKIIEFGEYFYKRFFNNLESIGFSDKYEKVVVRFHPSMQKIKYWNSEKIQIDENKNLYDSLKQFSNILGFTSTSLYEAFLMGHSVYSLSFGKDYFQLPMPYVGKINLDGEIDLSTKSIQIEPTNDIIDSRNIILKTITNTLKGKI